MRVKFAAGLFEFPWTDRSLLDLVGCKQHRELAREAVRKSLVLLKNGKDQSKPFLPLNRKAKRILVAGTHADDLGYQCGGWTKTWYGLKGRITIGTMLLDAIKEAVGDETEIINEQNPSTNTIERNDISYAIVAVGEPPYAKTPGDNSELVIPFNGPNIISSVTDKFLTRIILMSEKPLVLEPWLLKNIDALVTTWLPSTEAQGITDIVFGDYDFKGQLLVTWFRRVEDLDQQANGDKMHDPLFPLGFGLTCTKD